MSNTDRFDLDPVDALLAAAPDEDPAAQFADDIKQAASADQPVRIDTTLADLFAPPTPQPRRGWRPWVILRPAATVVAAFVAVLMLGAGAVALVGPQLADSIAGDDKEEVADDVQYEPDDVASDRESEDEDEVTDVRVIGTDRPDDDVDDEVVDDEPADRDNDADGNEVNEEAVLAWVSCMDAGFEAWLESFGNDGAAPEGAFGDCSTDAEGSLGVAGHEYKNAIQDWLACASEYGHSLKGSDSEEATDVVGECGEIPTFAGFGIDVPDDADADARDRTDDGNRESDELDDDSSRSGEGRDEGRGDVRNDSSDEGRAPSGDRTGEG